MDLFKQRLLVEAVRSIESDLPALTSTKIKPSNNQFEQLLVERAEQFDHRFNISPLLAHFRRVTSNLFNLISLFLFMVGAISVKHFFFSAADSQINFFWVFALFFIPNFLTLFLWFFFFMKFRHSNQAWLIRSSMFICKKIEQKFNPQSTKNKHFGAIFSSYFEVLFSAKLGRYQLSCLTHRLWFSYFLGACLMLVLMLATHQVDFIWQTSILSIASLQWLTELLAYIPELLGILVPSVSQIQNSHLGALNLLSDEQSSRLAWSSLLISSFIIYGLLPRLLLWLLMHFSLQQQQRHFTLNLSLAYYVQLRQHLKPLVTSLGVCDPNRQQQPQKNTVDTSARDIALPDFYYPVALELSHVQLAACKAHVAEYCPQQLSELKHLCDFQSEGAVFSDLSTQSNSAIVVYVALARLPDRGLLRLLTKINALNDRCLYLLLIDDNTLTEDLVEKRRSDWYQAAAQANIALDNIVQFEANSKGDV